jgi:cytochrome c553
MPLSRHVPTLLLAAAVLSTACAQPAQTPPIPTQTPAERGNYLVSAMGCHDCHTPWEMGPNGPEPNMSKALSGHPEGMKLGPVPALDMASGWGWGGSLSNTAFFGPWGVSYSANLTSDQNTGLGIWTEDMFVRAIRDGKHMGTSRQIMPPMPWPMIRNLNDDDLKAIFAYLKTIPAIANHVPEPIVAPGMAGGGE